MALFFTPWKTRPHRETVSGAMKEQEQEVNWKQAVLQPLYVEMEREREMSDRQIKIEKMA